MEKIKAEKIILVLFTDKDGRKLAGGANIEPGRDWIEIFSEAMDATKDNGGQVLDLNQ